jgi:HK97 family phage major capsid protein
MTDISLNDVHNSLKELRNTHEKGAEKLDALDLAKIEKCNKFLDLQEEKNQEITKKLQEEKSAREEMEAKYDALEAQVKAPNLSGEEKNDLKKSLECYDNFFKKGYSNLDDSEKKYLRTDNNANGGYLVEDVYIQEILKNITEISPVRQVARIFTNNAKSITIPNRNVIATTSTAGEGANMAASNSNYGSQQITAHKYFGRTDYTLEMINFAAFGIEQEIRSDLLEDLGRKEGADFINGTGVNGAKGILQESGLGETHSGAADALTADSLFEIQGELKSGYDPTFMFNRKTLHQNIRILKGTSNDHYYGNLFQLGQGGLPNTIAGVPYVIANDMPDVAANAFPIVFGDFRKGYGILDSTSIEIKRDDMSDIENGTIRYYIFKFTGGQVILKEAIKKLKIAA